MTRKPRLTYYRPPGKPKPLIPGWQKEPQQYKNFVETFIKCHDCGAAMWRTQTPSTDGVICLSDECRIKPPPNDNAYELRLQLERKLAELYTTDVGVIKAPYLTSEIDATQEQYKALVGYYYKYPITPAGRKRVPSNTPYTTSWPRTSPDILDKLKALVLRFIDWVKDSGFGEDKYMPRVTLLPPLPTKHIADGEHMATFAELFEEEHVPMPPRPNEPPGYTTTLR